MPVCQTQHLKALSHPIRLSNARQVQFTKWALIACVCWGTISKRLSLFRLHLPVGEAVQSSHQILVKFPSSSSLGHVLPYVGPDLLLSEGQPVHHGFQVTKILLQSFIIVCCFGNQIWLHQWKKKKWSLWSLWTQVCTRKYHVRVIENKTFLREEHESGVLTMKQNLGLLSFLLTLQLMKNGVVISRFSCKWDLVDLQYHIPSQFSRKMETQNRVLETGTTM